MHPTTILAFVAGAALTAVAAPHFVALQSDSDAKAMAEMMAKAKRWTQPGPNHKVLERFLGTWTTETRMFMGAQPGPAEKGSAEYTWLIEGRWLQCRSKGTMMNRPFEGFYLFGYDNFKMSFVTSAVNNFDTALVHTEGDMTQDGDVLITYGTLDEYLTGEHDKMVKFVWRFLSKDKIVLEIHDLPIGETNTKVVEIAYIRA